MLVDSLFFKQSRRTRSEWEYLIAIICVGSCYCVFRESTGEESRRRGLDKLDSFFSGKHNDTEPEKVSVEKVPRLKWSTLMGPSTREQVQKVIERKGKGWRLPTESELTGCYIECPYFHTYSHGLSYWLQREASLIERNGSLVCRNVSSDTKANFCLVREI